MRQLVLCVLCGAALSYSQGNRRNGPLPDHGTVEVTVTPIDQPASVQELTKRSQLIVEGEIVRILPTRQVNPDSPHSLETDSVIQLKRVLKGDQPSTTIAISQVGGKLGTKEAIVKQDPLFKVGEQYVVFLVRDDRKQANTSGFARYLVVGVWSGRAKIEHGKVQFSDEASPALRSQNNTTVESLVATIAKIAASQK